MEQITLYYRQGASDKVYQAAIEPKDGGCIVSFAFGRRGSTLSAGVKTTTPVPYEKAKSIFDKLIAEKKAKGYTPGEDGTPYRNTEKEERTTGIQCQLLNPIEEAEVHRLIANPEYWMQPKFDGRRLLLERAGESISGINRQGLRVAIPETLHQSSTQCPVDFLIDGEAVGDVLYAFDVLQIGGENLAVLPYLQRYLRLMNLLGSFQHPLIQLVENSCVAEEKAAKFQELKAAGQEGVVFKRIDAPYQPGRPASGGSQLKFKFCESASFFVAGINGNRSIALALFADQKEIPAGNVTIPPNFPIPKIGEIVEVRYLYAFKESGRIYQPVYLGVRDDVGPEDCTVDQLKYKAAAEAA